MLALVLDWEVFKDRLSRTVHLSHWDLHVVAGLAIFLLAGRLLRRPVSALLPLVPVAVLELANETLDVLRGWLPHWRWSPTDTLVEIGLTLGPPTALVLIARWRRRIRALRASGAGSA